MIGGFSANEIDDSAREAWAAALSNQNHPTNWATGKNWTLNSVETQVVAGTNYWFHVTSDQGEKRSVKVFVPLPHTNEKAYVTQECEGHRPAGCC